MSMLAGLPLVFRLLCANNVTMASPLRLKMGVSPLQVPLGSPSPLLCVLFFVHGISFASAFHFLRPLLHRRLCKNIIGCGLFGLLFSLLPFRCSFFLPSLPTQQTAKRARS
jgi:hypothetical protein